MKSNEPNLCKFLICNVDDNGIKRGQLGVATKPFPLIQMLCLAQCCCYGGFLNFLLPVVLAFAHVKYVAKITMYIA